MRPRLENYKKIFESECKKQSIEFSDEIFDVIVHKVTVDKGLELCSLSSAIYRGPGDRDMPLYAGGSAL